MSSSNPCIINSKWSSLLLLFFLQLLTYTEFVERGGGCIFYHSKISLYTKIPEWTGAVFYHNYAVNQRPWLDGCRIFSLSLQYLNHPWLDGCRFFLTIIHFVLQYNNILDWTGAVFHHNTAIYQHLWMEECRILPYFYITATSLTGRVPYLAIILHYNNIPDWTGAVFYHNIA